MATETGTLSVILGDLTLVGVGSIPLKQWLNPIQPKNVSTQDYGLMIGDPEGQRMRYDPVGGLEITGSVALGLPPPDSAASGTGIYMDESGIVGLNSGVVEVKLDSVTGKLVAGAGNVILDADGLRLSCAPSGFSAPSAVTWGSGVVPDHDVYGEVIGIANRSNLHIDCNYNQAKATGEVLITAADNSARGLTLALLCVAPLGGDERSLRLFPSSGVLSGFVIGANSSPTAMLDVRGDAVIAGVLFPQQAPTISAPAYVKGGIYFDTTLNKLRVGGASRWETITSI